MTDLDLYSNRKIICLISQAGESWIDETCSSKCTCMEGEVQCESYGCHMDAKCRVRNGIRDCYCNRGYKGDGQTCTLGELVEPVSELVNLSYFIMHRAWPLLLSAHCQAPLSHSI